MVFEKKKLSEVNGKRVVKMAAIGTFVLAPALHLWYGRGISWVMETKLSQMFPRFYAKLDSPFKKAAVAMVFDQTAWAFVCNSMMLFTIDVYDTLDPARSAANTRDKIWECTLANWKIWPLASLINFSVMPVRYRVLFANFVGYIWNIYLSWIGNRVPAKAT